jgi:hypothetical protein
MSSRLGSGLVGVADHHGGARFDQSTSDRSARSSSAAGHDGDATLQRHEVPYRPITSIGGDHGEKHAPEAVAA